MEETLKCKVCGRELPLGMFSLTKGGCRKLTCKDCQNAKAKQTKAAKRFTPPESIPEFDGKEPREVIEVLSRAKRWLELRGYTININCEYQQIKIIKIKV